MLSIKKAIFTLLITIFAFSNLYAAQDAAIVILVEGSAWVQRDGANYALKLKTPLFKTDKIITESNAKVQLLFNDDTSLTIGPSSELMVDDFLFGGSEKPKFAVNLVKGAARVISGKVVEQNPNGFSIGTPRTTVGIRGTDVAWQAGEGEFFLVYQIAKGHTVFFQNRATNNNITVERAGVYVVPSGINKNSFTADRVTPERANSLIESIFVSDSATSDRTGPINNSDGNTVQNDSVFKPVISEIGKDNIVIEKDKITTEVVRPSNPNTTIAHYRGNLTSGAEGVFGFKANLTNMLLSDGYIYGKSSNGTSFAAVGGAGNLDKDNLLLKDFSVVAGNNYPDVYNSSVNMSGSLSSSSVDVNWNYLQNGSTILQGNGKGSVVEFPNSNNDIKASYSGALSGGNFSGNFGFNTNLTRGTISDAYISANSKYGSVVAREGAGVLFGGAGAESVSKFLIGGFKSSGTGAYSAMGSASMYGDISGNSLLGIWEANNAGGYYITGTATGNSGAYGELPSLPQNEVTASFNGALAGAGITSGSFGFNANLTTSIVSSAYILGVSGNGSFLGVNGTGKLSQVSTKTPSFGISGFTMSGNGVYESVDSATIDKGIINYGDDSVSFDATVNGNGEILGSFTGNGEYSESLGTIPTLPEYNVIANYKGSIIDADVSNGKFGFSLNLGSNVISNAYLVGSTASGNFLGTNGSGMLSLGSFGISGFLVSGNGGFEHATDMSVTNGLIDSSKNVTFDYSVGDRTGQGSGGYITGGLGNIPTLPEYNVIANYKGELDDDGGVSSGRFGFSLNLGNKAISGAYIVGTTSRGNFLGTNGSGTLSSGVFGISGFTVSGNGRFEHATDMSVTNGFINSANDVYFDYSVGEAGISGLEGEASGGFVNGGLGNIPTLPSFQAIARYAGNVNGGVTGPFGFNLNLANNTINDFYMYSVGDSRIVAGGKGTYSGGSFVIDTLPIYRNALLGSEFFNGSGTIAGGMANLNWSISNLVGNTISGTGAGNIQDTTTSVLVHYSASNVSGGVTSAMGFSMNTAQETISNAYFYEDSIYGTIRATQGSGVTRQVGSNKVAVGGGFVVEGTGMYSPADIGGMYSIYDATTFVGDWTAGSTTASAQGTVNGALSTLPGDVPNMPTGEKIAHYRGNMTSAGSGGVFTSGSAGFDVNFSAASDHVSNAFIHGENGSSNKFLATGGSGSLDMKMSFAEYDINNFTNIQGTGTFNGYNSAEINGQVSRGDAHNTLNWKIENGTNTHNGNVNIGLTNTPGPTPSID